MTVTMDLLKTFTGYTLAIFMSLTLLVKSENQYDGLPQLLSPKHLDRFSGKIIYYEPKNVTRDTESTTVVPWEDVLKETVILTLNDQNHENKTKKSVFTIKRRQKEIYRAPYKGAIDNETPRFGDIVLVAKGRLEKANNESYVFVQSERNCDRRCYERSQNSDNVTAMWMVERIRHRDAVRGHRYELRFTVVPLNEDKSYGADTGLRISKSFIVRDEDYPRYFVNENIGHAVTRRSDIFTTSRRTLASVMEMFDIMPLINAISPFTPRLTGRPELSFGNVPQGNQIRGAAPTMTVMRLPVPKVQFPAPHQPQRTPFSSNPMSGVHIFLNNPPQNVINQPSGLKKPQFQYYGKPMFHLDKATDYNHAMEYQGAINAKKLYPSTTQKYSVTPSPSPAPVHENTLDWKPSNPITSHARRPTAESSVLESVSVSTAESVTADGVSSGSTPNQNTLIQTNPPSSAYQLTTVFGKDHTHSPQSNLLFDPVSHQIPTTQLHHPLIFPHFQAPPAFMFPLQNHLSHTPFGPLQMQILPPANNAAAHLPAQQQQSHVVNDGMSTTTHYGQSNGLGPIPPFVPLHPTMQRVRPLSRYPTSPPRKEVNVHVFRESQRQEKNKFSEVDPWYTTVTPSAVPLKSVLRSPYSHSTQPITTVIPEETYTQRPFTPTIPFEPTRISDKLSPSTKPDSINAQLPKPEKGMNTKIPYVSEIKTTKQSNKKTYSTPSPTSETRNSDNPRPSLRTKPFRPSTLLSVSSTGPTALDYSTSRYKNSYKTTEKPVLKWIPKKARTKPTEAADTVTSTVRSYDRYTTTTRAPRFETTTTRPRSIPNITTARPSPTATSTAAAPTSTEVRTSVTSNSTRFRGRSRYNRRKDNITHNGVLEGASTESKPRISSIEVLNGRRKIKRTRLSVSRSTTTKTPSTTTTTTSTVLPPLQYFTTSTAFPFLPTTTIEPPSTTAEIIRAVIHPIDTNSTDVHLFRATDITAPDSNELDGSLADAIIKHAREMHSPGFYYNKKQKLYRAYGDSNTGNNEDTHKNENN